MTAERHERDAILIVRESQSRDDVTHEAGGAREVRDAHEGGVVDEEDDVGPRPAGCDDTTTGSEDKAGPPELSR